jgi:hypothetical protein
MNAAFTVIVAIGLIAWVIGRQLKGELLRAKRVVLLPLVLIVIGGMNLHCMHHLNAADLACIGVGSVIAAGIGLGQGATMRLEARQGELWGQLPVRGLWLWGALLASRLTLVVVALPLGAHAVSSLDSILLVLGINRLAQAAVIAARAISAGIPFAAEKDGRTFLPGLSGQGQADRFGPRS